MDGRLVALGTFDTCAEATEAVDRRRFGDPSAALASSPPLSLYIQQWLELRQHDLRPRTRELYESLHRVHVRPTLGEVALNELTSARIRRWHAEMAQHNGAAVTARVYRFVRAVLNTALQDELIVKNPCAIRGAGVDRTKERPTATIAQVYSLADAIDHRHRFLVLLAAFSALRQGELLGLRRRDVDVNARTVNVERQIHTLRGGEVIIGPPKTDAGIRVVSIPDTIATELQQHLDRYCSSPPEALLFTDRNGQPVRRWAIAREWRRARDAVELPHLRFHDLRHTAATLAASTGATTKELMARLGHRSPRAALMYQHSSRERDTAIASALDDAIRSQLLCRLS